MKTLIRATVDTASVGHDARHRERSRRETAESPTEENPRFHAGGDLRLHAPSEHGQV